MKDYYKVQCLPQITCAWDKALLSSIEGLIAAVLRLIAAVLRVKAAVLRVIAAVLRVKAAVLRLLEALLRLSRTLLKDSKDLWLRHITWTWYEASRSVAGGCIKRDSSCIKRDSSCVKTYRGLVKTPEGRYWSRLMVQEVQLLKESTWLGTELWDMMIKSLHKARKTHMKHLKGVIWHYHSIIWSLLTLKQRMRDGHISGVKGTAFQVSSLHHKEQLTQWLSSITTEPHH